MTGTYFRRNAKIACFVLAAIALTLTVFIAGINSVEAHANLLRSSPSALEELETPPQRVILWFTEPIEPAFSSISVLSGTGAEMTSGSAEFDPAEPTAMWAPMGDIDPGTYTVVWRNVSTVDGHNVFGSFLFSFGAPIDGGTQSTELDQPILQANTDPFIRWAIYIGIAILFGGLIFELFVLSPYLSPMYADPSVFYASRKVGVIFFTVALIALIGAMLAQLAQLLQQTLIAYDISFVSLSFNQIIKVVVESDWGRYWSYRLAFGAIALFALFMAHRSRGGISASEESKDYSTDDENTSALLMDSPWGILALSSAALYLVLISLSSHSAAVPEDVRWIALPSDIAHVTAASIWIGGLVYLLTCASVSFSATNGFDRRTLLIKLIPRFTPLALLSAAVLVGSGIVATLMQVTIPEALATPYGYAFLGKLLLAIALLALALYNMLSVSRRLAAQPQATITLKRTVAAEIAVAVLALLAAAWMASLEPARQYAERKGIGIEDSVIQTLEISGGYAQASLDPGEVGNNTLTIRLNDLNGESLKTVEEVRARVKYLDQEFGEPYLPILKTEDGLWRQEDVQIGVSGAYQVEVSVTRSDAFDSRFSFRFSAKSTAVASDLIRPTPTASQLLLGIQIIIVAIAFFASGIARLPRADLNLNNYLSSSRVFVVSGALLLLAGGLVSINAATLGIGVPSEDFRNPFPLSQESIGLGEVSYASNCATCHGETGRGDGPAAAGLNPAPADLAIHVPLHSDADLFDFIANGIDGTAMVPQLGNLSEDEIWHIVNFMRTIEE